MLLRLKSLTRSVRMALAGLIRRAAPTDRAGDDTSAPSPRPMRPMPSVGLRPGYLAQVREVAVEAPDELW